MPRACRRYRVRACPLPKDAGLAVDSESWSGFRVGVFHTNDDRVISKPQTRNRLRPKLSRSRSFGYAWEPVLRW